MRIATLGPKGSFSHQATLEYFKSHGMNSENHEIIFTSTIMDIFELVQKRKASLGITPIENSMGGSVRDSLNALLKLNLFIIEELVISVKHHLAGWGNIGDIKIIYSHPQTRAQCRNFLKEHLNEAEIIETSSNSKSAELLARYPNDKTQGAIVPKLARELYSLKLVDSYIQDSKNNMTRFIIISKATSQIKGKHNKTSILLYPKNNKSGVLYNILDPFAKKGIDLTKIESWINGQIGQYIFFVDCLAHYQDESFLKCISHLTDNGLAKVKFLGSYLRSC
ncbi:prephenate dehydratase [Patescibacteria group bacterium]